MFYLCSFSTLELAGVIHIFLYKQQSFYTRTVFCFLLVDPSWDLFSLCRDLAIPAGTCLLELILFYLSLQCLAVGL